MNTGENQQGLQKILDMTRLISIVVLAFHFYYYCYQSFYDWGLSTKITDQVFKNLAKTGLFNQFLKTKWIALAFLILSLLGARGRKTENLKMSIAWKYISVGLCLYFLSYFLLHLQFAFQTITILYILVTVLGYLMILKGGTLISRVIQVKLNNKDI